MRNMSPAFDQPEPGSLFCKLRDLRNHGAVAGEIGAGEIELVGGVQMSAPPPFTVHKPLS